MATAKCPSCSSTQFEASENSPTNSKFKLIFVQCARCGVVVGTMDYYNIGARLAELEQKIEAIRKSAVHFGPVASKLDNVDDNIVRLSNYLHSKFDDK